MTTKMTQEYASRLLNGGDLRSSSLAADLDGLLSSLRLNPSSVDLVVDLQIFDKAVHNLGMICSVVPNVLKWRTLTVASGAFPKNLVGLSVGQHHLPRLEWESWRKQVTSHLSRRPTYGDYATLHPYLTSWFLGMNVSASIRYTVEESWLIMRGEGLRNEGGTGYAQYPANAELLCYHPEYCGPDFSFGDRYIYEIGSKKQKTGRPETWLTAGVNHHLTFVARQIAGLFGI